MSTSSGPAGPRDKDLLGRRVLAQALAEKLHGHVTGPADVDPGPAVVTVEGPWGSGKSTLLDLIRDYLPEPAPAPSSAPRLTVRQASQLLRDGAPPSAAAGQAPTARGVVTAWFNPWAHQSGEQVWAGLVAEIIEAARPVLYPSDTARERYWLARNLTRIDRYAVRRTLHRRMLSPELTLGALGVVASLVIAVAELENTLNFGGFSVPAATVALAVAGTFLLAGFVHTGWRYLRGTAARFLPGELFHGPVSLTAEIDAAEPNRAEGLSDPLRRARAGSLYLHQHDVSELIADLSQAGYELIMFIDDLDRCRALTTAEVFEAINLFLAGFVAERRGTGRDNPGDPGGSLRARFVIGLDPVVVAGHLDRVYADLFDAGADSGDAGPGWAFLRKLVHLPVMVPQITDGELLRIIDQMTGPHLPVPAPPEPIEPVATLPKRFDPSTSAHELIRQRLLAQPDRSIREASRMLNVWEFYERVLAATVPATGPGQDCQRSRHTVILAEVITRWPSLQRFLHQRHPGGTGLQLLASAAAGTDEQVWRSVVDTVTGGRTADVAAFDALRGLLADRDGQQVASLGAQLL